MRTTPSWLWAAALVAVVFAGCDGGGSADDDAEDAGKPEDEQLTQFEPRNWEDTFSVRLGAEVRPPVEGLALRAGLVYDRSPSPTDTMSPSLPDCDRIDVSVGAGYAFDFGLVIDLAYMYVHFLGRSSTGEAFPGSYEASAHLMGLSLGYRWEPL